jgi:hypothetical protein
LRFSPPEKQQKRHTVNDHGTSRHGTDHRKPLQNFCGPALVPVSNRGVDSIPPTVRTGDELPAGCEHAYYLR